MAWTRRIKFTALAPNIKIVVFLSQITSEFLHEEIEITSKAKQENIKDEGNIIYEVDL